MLIHNIQPSFAGGEVSPHVQARVDDAGYNTWLKTACNFYVHPQGGASNRQGTAFVRETKYADKAARLVPFVLGEEESYVLEFGHNYLRIHTSAGTIEKDGSVYELETPYDQYDIANLNYTQYDQTLFLVHPNHFPKKLTRNAADDFALEDVNVKGGPFMLANTDENKKMHLTESEDQVVSQGVSASLTFQPVVYYQYFIQAYFSGQLFYMAEDYGFNIPAMIARFNAAYGGAGYRGECLGGSFRLESPAATGGDCNGQELRLEYRSSFYGAADLVVVQKLSGGSNAGEKTPSGEKKLVLESDFDFFKPGQAGGLFTLMHTVESQNVKGTFGYEGNSQSIKSGGDWRFRTTGSWYGQIVLESSADKGVTWKKVKHFTRAQGEDNLNQFGNLEQTAEMNYLRLRGLQITGELGYELQADAFVQEGIVKMTEYLGPRRMRAEVKRQLGADDWTKDWAEGSFSEAAGFPSCVFFFQDRLGFAGTKQEPQTLWFSKTGEYEDFGHFRTLEDSDGLSVNLSSKKLNAINSVAVSSKLLIFTAGSEWTLSCDGALTPYNIQIAQQGERGASKTAPVVVGNKALYVQSRGGVLRDFYYEYSSASYTGDDLTILSKHLFFNKEIKELSYQQEPDNLIWCVLSDGTLLSLTYLVEEKLCAWTRHETQGSFESVCGIPSRGFDETWFVVRRGDKRFVERLLQRLPTKDPEDQVFLDCSVSKKSETEFSVLGGLEHLEGREVSVLADGNPLGLLTVKNGQITLPRAVRAAHAGLAYEAVLQTLPTEFMLADGTVQDRKRRVVSVTLKLLDSRGGWLGTESGKLDEILQRAPAFNTPAELQTREYVRLLPGSHSLAPSLVFKQTDPLPVTVLAFITRVA